MVIADAGHWHKREMETVVGRGIQVLIPRDSGLRTRGRPGWDGGLYAFMRRVLATDHGKALYRKCHGRRRAPRFHLAGGVEYAQL